MEDMIDDIGEDNFKSAQVYDSLKDDSEKSLYPGCTRCTRLSAILKLFNIKARNGWTDRSFSELLELLHEMLPEGNMLSTRHYEAKKILCPMGMEYQKIHVCPNDCILYRKEFETLTKCSRCGVSRFKVKDDDVDEDNMKKGPPAKVKSEGLLRHAADSPQWKKIDTHYPQFGSDPRNLRLGLATDGMNPYGPNQLGNDIGVYLTPLIEDLGLLWDEGVKVFDAYGNDNFNLRALLFCTINDFSAYGNLSSYSVKGHYACPICEENTSYHQLKHGRKTCYIGHRKFLRRNHPYRRLKKAFHGYQEDKISPPPLNEEEVYERVCQVNVTFGKILKKPIMKNIWKKNSIFFQLPYWAKLDVKHCIDVMHVEKNVCDSIIGTLLNIKGKTKDDVNSRKDLVEMGLRLELQPQAYGKRTYLPPACHTLSKVEKKSFCACLYEMKVP
ncbi:uncharacterized protein LOC114180521 [Vigna unguiculata]|uniref:uncharacterized protein LOC114180521 n=1 Tax=Vigna unguiculata TaxID=3917 RepID=UPI00101609C5|nr:uncharacterized protein LOC114180521 [Vigna unguiculata]